ncbi:MULTISPECIES: phosphotransferase [unclassified Niallia]|uniref:phosphotransferase n=1 Tax=unclassified Niallia TaxID=2837522 RepID=UPI001EDB59BF|nr:phosphotransferase [Niallia sp. Man26]UPO90319.1 aminoglycoside phosphotransferase family protein [Niallia sp. Man26]
MDIQKVIKLLLHNNILHEAPLDYHRLNGGTVSELYVLNLDNSKVVVKKNQPKIVEAEAKFLQCYKDNSLLPKLLFVEQTNGYFVYSFIEGTVNDKRVNKKDMLQKLVQGLLNTYTPVATESGWGWADEPSVSWEDFITAEMKEANDILQHYLDNYVYQYILNVATKRSGERKQYLLHGDCGVHNFIFHDRQLAGVIDPTPVIGEPLYDLIYAFCSSPDDLTKETFNSAVGLLASKHNLNEASLYEEVLIGLYLRLATCIKHHPSALEDYLTAWNYWVRIVEEMNRK